MSVARIVDGAWWGGGWGVGLLRRAGGGVTVTIIMYILCSVYFCKRVNAFFLACFLYCNCRCVLWVVDTYRQPYYVCWRFPYCSFLLFVFVLLHFIIIFVHLSVSKPHLLLKWILTVPFYGKILHLHHNGVYLRLHLWIASCSTSYFWSWRTFDSFYT